MVGGSNIKQHTCGHQDRPTHYAVVPKHLLNAETKIIYESL